MRTGALFRNGVPIAPFVIARLPLFGELPDLYGQLAPLNRPRWRIAGQHDQFLRPFIREHNLPLPAPDVAEAAAGAAEAANMAAPGRVAATDVMVERVERAVIERS